MLKILFICHGNICRSPMAEFVMKKMVSDAGLENEFYIASAATSTEEIGNSVYPPARRMLNAHGISCDGKTARQIRRSDYDEYDLLVYMDRENLWGIRRIFGNDDDNKVHSLLSYVGSDRDVADPWYTGDFQATWDDVNVGCRAILKTFGYDVDLLK